MSFHPTALWRSFPAVLLLGLIAPSAAFGQLPTSPIRFVNEEAITTSFVTAPDLNTDTSNPSPGEPSQWLKVEFHYGTTDLVTTVYPYVDAVEFKVWIEGLDQYAPNSSQASGKGVAVGLTGSVTYVNIPVGKDIYGVFYVNPSTLVRYSSERGYEDFDQKFNIHIEAYVGGTKVDYFDKKKEQDPNWFVQLKPISGLVCRQDQCPFLISNPGRYPMIKLPAPAQ